MVTKIIKFPVIQGVIFIVLFLNASDLLAQHTFMGRDFVYGRSNIYLTAHPGLSPKPNVTDFNNPYGFEFRPLGRADFVFGFIYQYNFNRKFGLSMGMLPALVSFRQFRFEYALTEPVLDQYGLVPDNSCLTCHSLINHTVSFPLFLNYRVKLGQRLDLSLNAGLSLKVGRSFYYEWNAAYYSQSSDSTFHTIRVTLTDRNKRDVLLPNVLVGLGFNQLLRNNHYINYQISLDIPTVNPLTNGSFVFMSGTPYESAGKFKIYPLVIGLEVNYVFTFKNKKFRQGFQANTVTEPD